MFDNLVNELSELNPDGRKFDLDVKIQLLRAGAGIPSSAHLDDACDDIQFCPDNRQPFLLLPGQTAVLETGLAMEIPVGWELQVRSRSGLAAKQSLFVLNGPGTVDSNYRGEVKVILHRALSGGAPDTYSKSELKSFFIKPGDRIAQICFKPIYRARYGTVKQLTSTDRGAGGFGSSGT
jgi:dUTP pyrophosphatase